MYSNIGRLLWNEFGEVLGRSPSGVLLVPGWHFSIFHLWVVHLGNRYITRPVRAFKEFATQMAPTLFPTLPT